MKSLEVRSLNVHYGALEAIHQLDLDVEEEEIVFLVGPNGAGKSTFLKALANVVPGSSGSIKINETATHGMAPEDVVRLGFTMVPEGRDIFGTLTVEENLKLGAYSRSDADGIQRDFNMIVEEFHHLRNRLYGPAGFLSGGEQQMLAIGRGLMTAFAGAFARRFASGARCLPLQPGYPGAAGAAPGPVREARQWGSAFEPQPLRRCLSRRRPHSGFGCPLCDRPLSGRSVARGRPHRGAGLHGDGDRSLCLPRQLGDHLLRPCHFRHDRSVRLGLADLLQRHARRIHAWTAGLAASAEHAVSRRRRSWPQPWPQHSLG